MNLRTSGVIAITISAALLTAPISATAATPTAGVATGSISIGSTISQLTANDWKQIAARAKTTGDFSAAKAATDIAQRKMPLENRNVARPANVVVTIAKKAVIAALRYGADRLPKKWRPYASKAANFLDDLQKWQEGPIISGLMAMGVPADVAQGIATWVVVFGGL
ncbi:hypothetical protein [Glutamicibacter sp.]|uniref:hypothetical protein n=1 Tax=Glutamicibacter sp. TaxID=1931995 RepID=UPI0028BDDE01|nr:hypothetical protein [Glutamicibacter sp.]